MADNYCSHCGTQLPPDAGQCPECGKRIKKGLSPLVIVLIVIGIFVVFILPMMGIIAAILIPNFLRARAQGQFTQCQSNMKNIGAALEMYSTDNGGHYPDSLKKIAPDYLREIPTCASAGTDTYSGSYTSVMEDKEQGTEEAYTFYCKGDNHTAVGNSDNYPQYNSRQGLIPFSRRSEY